MNLLFGVSATGKDHTVHRFGYTQDQTDTLIEHSVTVPLLAVFGAAAQVGHAIARVHLDQVEVAFVIEPSEAFGEIVVKPVEHLPPI